MALVERAPGFSPFGFAITPCLPAVAIRRIGDNERTLFLARVTAAFCCGEALALSLLALAFSWRFALRVAEPAKPACPRWRARLAAWRVRKDPCGFAFFAAPPPGVKANRPRASRT